MDPQSYQQAMIQQLMGGATMAPGTTGQNASTPYGAGFMTGNMAMPQWMNPATGQMAGAGGQQQQQPGMLGQGPASVLAQPMATYA